MKNFMKKQKISNLLCILGITFMSCSSGALEDQDHWQLVKYEGLDVQICTLKIYIAQKALNTWIEGRSPQPVLDEIKKNLDIIAQNYPEFGKDLTLYANLSDNLTHLTYTLYKEDEATQQYTKKLFLSKTVEEKQAYWDKQEKSCLEQINSANSYYQN